MTDSSPRVFLVGAGPGNPGLLTLRAIECLRQADFVLYDKLVPVQLLEHLPPTARRLCVTELPGRHPERYPHIHRTLIEMARQGLRVVRLKGGDPFLFGRGGEEAEALREAGIPYEVVPGVTAALGVSAFAGIPLTHREHASAVAFVTGHENPHKTQSAIDWPALARFPGTLVIYMGIAQIGPIVQTLIQHGKPATTPAAVVHWGTTGDQRAVEATLAELPRVVLAEGIMAPALILIGSVVELRGKLAWFERRPLFGHRVLVTRPRHQAGDLLRRLEVLGAVPYLLPAVAIREAPAWGPVDRALAQLRDYQWLVFTSANGVQAFLGRLRCQGLDLRALGGVRLAVIGPATADALRDYHLEPDVMPRSFRSEALAEELKPLVAGQRVLLARADRGRDLLRQELSAVAAVDQVAVYSQVDAIDTHNEVFDCLRRGEIDYVTLTSSNIARAFLQSLDDVCRTRIQAGDIHLVTISSLTSAAVRAFDLPVAAEAPQETTLGVTQALIEHVRQGTPCRR
ncbi:MAG: uroporphyrinogen-III C-methyltransferase [Gemmataceae bacterium]